MDNKPARRFRFTWNNYTEDDVARLMDVNKLDPSIDYLTFSFEIGEQGTPHLQGYVEYNKATRINASCKKLDPTRGGRGKGATPHAVWCLVADKNRQANINYVNKPETKDPAMMMEDGITPIIFKWQRPGNERTRGEGAAEERKAEWTAKLEYLRENPDLATFSKENPEEGFKYSHGIKMLSAAMKENDTREMVTSLYPYNMRMRLWQRSLVKLLSRDADDRSIFWIYDEAGGGGKSILTKWLGVHAGACCLSNGRTQDISFAYKGERIVIFDLTRSMEETINYSAIEMLKNGTWFSAKYESAGKIVAPPWVLIFANCLPQTWRMTGDRWAIIDLSKNPGGMELEPNEGTLTEVKFPSSKGIAMNDPLLASLMG